MKNLIELIVAMVMVVGCVLPLDGNDRPNVVLFMTDDQGYGDLGCHGNPVLKTPHLDRLHAESVRLTNFHVDPTCAPTRAVLLTGKYSHRVKVWHTIAGGNHLRAGDMTMAEVFRASGYRTGLFGKWHLGANYPYRPMDRGFDEWLGHGDGRTGTTDDYFTKDRVDDHYLHNGEWEYRKGYAPDVFFDAAIDFVKAKSDSRPCFVYLNTYMPHTPHTLPDSKWTEEYADWLLPLPPWNHEQVAKGNGNSGTWIISAAEPGKYRFEVRRWPREVDAPIAGVPVLQKTVDAYDPKSAKPTLIYATEKSPLKALPVVLVRLRVGDFDRVVHIQKADTHIVFEVPLETRAYEVQADLLDAQSKLIGGGYYVYCRRER